MAINRGVTPTIAEIFALLKKCKTKKDRVLFLKDYRDHLGVKTIIRLQFDPRFKFALPPGIPEDMKLNDTPAGLGRDTLNNSIKKLYLFIEGAAKIKQIKREMLFLGLLEVLDKDEAVLLLAVKDKKLDVGLTRALVDEVFPGLIPSDVKDTSDEKGKKEVSNDKSV